MNFKYSFWKEWRRLVKEHWDNCLIDNPIVGAGEERYKSVSEKYKKRYESDDEEVVNKYLYTAYGTTFLLCILIDSQILLLQIGDGTCVVLKDDGNFSCPVPPDEDNFLNVVVSLCEENAYHNIRHAIINCRDDSPKPIAVFLSSDGLDDCYPIYENEEYLYRLYSVIINNIVNKGFDSTEEELTENLLPGLTSQGSQDDISLAYMICKNTRILKDTYGKIPSDYKVE